MLAASNYDNEERHLPATVPSSLAVSWLLQPQDLPRSFAAWHPHRLTAAQHSRTIGQARNKSFRIGTQSNRRTSASWVPEALQHTRCDWDRLEDCLADPHLFSQKALRPRVGRCVLVYRQGLHPRE